MLSAAGKAATAAVVEQQRFKPETANADVGCCACVEARCPKQLAEVGGQVLLRTSPCPGEISQRLEIPGLGCHLPFAKFGRGFELLDVLDGGTGAIVRGDHPKIDE